jgi:hypothetical protein
MSGPSNVDQVVAGIRDLVQAMMARNEGQIGGHESVTAAQSNLRDVIERVLGTKERVES